MIRRLRERLRSDEGFTLVELIVVSLLGVLVVGVVGGIYITTIGVQRLVGGMTQGTSDGQVAAQDIDAGVRNANEFDILPRENELLALPTGDQMLMARSLDASADGVWFCRAWYFSAGDGSIRRHSVLAPETDDPDDDFEIPVPTAAELAGWSLLTTGVRPTEGTAIFFDHPSFEGVLVVDFTTTDNDDTDGAYIRFSTPLMPESTEEETCF